MNLQADLDLLSKSLGEELLHNLWREVERQYGLRMGNSKALHNRLAYFEIRTRPDLWDWFPSPDAVVVVTICGIWPEDLSIFLWGPN